MGMAAANTASGIAALTIVRSVAVRRDWLCSRNSFLRRLRVMVGSRFLIEGS
jgi:hypothetical protein